LARGVLGIGGCTGIASSVIGGLASSVIGGVGRVVSLGIVSLGIVLVDLILLKLSSGVVEPLALCDDLQKGRAPIRKGIAANERARGLPAAWLAA
jgi:hypothetical protein